MFWVKTRPQQQQKPIEPPKPITIDDLQKEIRKSKKPRTEDDEVQEIIESGNENAKDRKIKELAAKAKSLQLALEREKSASVFCS
jgi:hypothetical protein